MDARKMLEKISYNVPLIVFQEGYRYRHRIRLLCLNFRLTFSGGC